MKRVASLYLPNWSIDRLRRTEHRRATPPDRVPPLREEGLAAQLTAVGECSAEERSKQCSVPKEGGWRPGARWARRGRGQTVFEPNRDAALPPGRTLPSEREREDVEAAVAGLPLHQRPPSRELGRVSEAAPNPFAGTTREMAERCEAATHPFKPDTEGWTGTNLQTAIDDLPPHQRPSAKSLLRGTTVIGDPFASQTRMPVQFPGEDAPAKRSRGKGMQKPKRPTSRDGHNGEAGAIAPPNLARLADMPAPRHHGEGVRPPKHAGAENLDETGLEKGRFFQTGRTLGPMVGRVCRDGERGTTRAARTAQTPLATIEKIGARVELVAVCPAARAAGLRPGMALTTARAQLPDLDTRPSDREADRRDLARLAELLARRWSPVVEISDEDGLLIDLTGVAHLRGGEEAFCRRLVRLLDRRGFTARIAVADTAGAAWGLSRYAFNAVQVVPPGEQETTIAPLPPAALKLDATALELLDRLGVVRIGELIAMPRAPLARRFGRTIVDRLDRALGCAPQALDPVTLHEAVSVTRRFLEPIATAEAIEQVLRDMTPDLAEALRQAARGVRSLELVAERVDGVPQRLRVGFARATRDAAHMLRLMLRRIEEIEPGYGIDAMTLHVRRCDALGAEALGPKLAEDGPPDLSTLIDAIANRIGADRIWRVCPVESEVPERSVRRIAPLDGEGRSAPRLAVDDVARLDETPVDHPWHPRWRRPARLLPRPERVQHVMSELPDLPPKRFTWRGQTHRIVAAEGPERITGEWWRRPDEKHGERWGVRDYFHVETDEGKRFWLFRRGDGVRSETGDLTWYMHGR